MSLVADYSTSSSNSSDSDDDSETEQQRIQRKKNDKTKLPGSLPSANLLLPKVCDSSGGSNRVTKKATARGEVFSNPFLEAENAKRALLEKHVKMVSNEDHLTEKNGRKICWNNRKGRCRFGSKCHYAHDSDVVTAATAPAARVKKDHILFPSPSSTISAQPSGPSHLTQHDDSNNMPVCSSFSTEESKRKRPGLSDSIQPGKRVLKAYTQQQRKS